jgi:hypothetical protein
MTNPDEICIRLYSALFPCPWIDSIPHLKTVSTRLQDSLEGFDTSFPAYLQEVLEQCQGCVNYDPVGLYIRKKY